MTLDHVRYEVRILGPVLFGIPLVLALAFIGITALLFIGNVEHGFIASVLIAALEACLPLSAGIILSTVAVQDASLELLLTMPSTYRGVVFLRFALLLIWTLLVEFLATLALYAILPWVPVKPLLQGQLTWLARLPCGSRAWAFCSHCCYAAGRAAGPFSAVYGSFN